MLDNTFWSPASDKQDMNKINRFLDHAEAICRDSGSRLTEKRRRVLTGLLKSQKAMSAYDLVEYWRTEFDESIPPMSVYRMLEFLESENLAHKLRLNNKYVACSHISCDHAHEVPQFLICDECGTVREIGIKKSLVEALRRSVHEADFVLKCSQLELPCLCQDCANRDT